MGTTQLLNPTNQTLLAQIEHVDAIPLKNNTSLSVQSLGIFYTVAALVVILFIRHFFVYIQRYFKMADGVMKKWKIYVFLCDIYSL